MFDFLFPNHPFGGHTLRLVAQAQQGGGDVFDIARAMKNVEAGRQSGVGARLVGTGRENRGASEASACRGSSAHSEAIFFSRKQLLSNVRRAADDRRRTEARRTFSQVPETIFAPRPNSTSPKIEVITVRCGNEEYDGYFCHPVNPKPGKWPAVLFLGGADAYAEEIYFGGKQMLERGWAMLLVDTPGRGSSIYLERNQDSARLRSAGKSVHRLSGFASRSRCRSRRAARHQHGRLLCAARGGIRKKNQSIGCLERLLQRAR